MDKSAFIIVYLFIPSLVSWMKGITMVLTIQILRSNCFKVIIFYFIVYLWYIIYKYLRYLDIKSTWTILLNFYAEPEPSLTNKIGDM